MNPIVGIGELLWDVYPDGRKVAGGAPFNFAFHCHQLGHEGVIVSRVGDDDLGRELREEVKRRGMSDEFIQTDHEHPTGTVRVDANGQPSYEIAENVAWDRLNPAPTLVALGRSVATVSYGTLAGRGQRSADTIREFLSGCDHSLRVFDLNFRTQDISKRYVEELLMLANWLKLNVGEVCFLKSSLGQHTAGSVRDAFHQLRPWLHEKTVVLTHGLLGCEVFSGSSDEDDFFDVGTPVLDAVDTVGAGDAFTAAMVCLHLEGRPLVECARFANHYAARVCEHIGATPVIERSEVERAAFG